MSEQENREQDDSQGDKAAKDGNPSHDDNRVGAPTGVKPRCSKSRAGIDIMLCCAHRNSSALRSTTMQSPETR